MEINWEMNFNAAITVCDTDGIIRQMNEQAALVLQKDGGMDLVGKNALECHPEPARLKMVDLLENQKTNVYTIEKNGKKKLIYQAPWYNGNKFAGLVEISLPLPEDVPHFIRK
jgi:transcriptional regulator with PAS, ATPase and Fis domain